VGTGGWEKKDDLCATEEGNGVSLTIVLPLLENTYTALGGPGMVPPSTRQHAIMKNPVHL